MTTRDFVLFGIASCVLALLLTLTLSRVADNSDRIEENAARIENNHTVHHTHKHHSCGFLPGLLFPRHC